MPGNKTKKSPEYVYFVLSLSSYAAVSQCSGAELPGHSTGQSFIFNFQYTLWFVTQSALVFCSHDICTDDSYVAASNVGQVRQDYCLYLSPSTYTHCILSLHTPHPPPHTPHRKGGIIVNLSTVGALGPCALLAVYTASKVYGSQSPPPYTHIPPKLHTLPLHIHPYFCA